MIDKKIEQLKIFKNVNLSDQERFVLRAKIAKSIQTLESKPKVSYFYSGIQHGLRISLSTFLFIVFVGGSVSVVADNSLPGDALYPIKISVNEQIKGALIKNPEAKISYQTTLIDNRLTEIKTLAASKTLTKAKQETAQKALDSHIESLSKQLGTLSDEKPKEALKVTASLEESLKAQKEDLEKIVVKEENGSSTDALKAVDETLKKVSDQEVKIISKEIDQLVIDIKNVPETKSDKEDKDSTSNPTSSSSQTR
ncbi:hypothetical protein IT402_00880 [Candidatus Nomurabacteria bacterium]|nr:hypothetical protein [Candidatus Nomurabacteria bacterium]